MTCPDKKVLMMWADGEITGSEADAISRHTAQCEDCKAFVSAQKKLESIWRNAWVDPDEVAFDTMRKSVQPATSWWQMQRVWYTAAAICAVYLGVRVFYTGPGTSLSDIAVVEAGSTAGAVDEPLFSEQEELIQDEEALEEMIIPEEECPSPQSEISEIDGTLSDIQQLSAAEVVLNEDTEAGANVIHATSERLQSTQKESAVETEDISERLDYVGSAGCATVIGEAVPEGGGGGYALGSGGQSSGDFSDDIQKIYPVQASACSPASESYSVSLTLESNEIIFIQRYEWNSLFAQIDTLQHRNSYSTTESVVLKISDGGVFSEPATLAGIAIDIPEESYGNCVVTVLFF